MRDRWLVSLASCAMCLPGLARASAVADQARYAAIDRLVDQTRTAMVSDPARALVLADRTLASAHMLPPSPRARLAIATADWLDGEAHISLNQPERASAMIEAALATANRLAPDTKLQGDLLRSRGAIARTQGYVQDALRAYQLAYRAFTVAHEPRSQAMALQDIGQIYKDAGDHERALGYYAQMAAAYGKDPMLLLTSANDQADILHDLGRIREAEDQCKVALRNARLLNSAVLETRVLANLAIVQAERGEVAAAQASVDRAMLLTRSGEASSWRLPVLGTAAKVAAARGDLVGAGQLFDRMFAGVDLATTDLPFRDFHQTASDVYERLGREDLALAHLRAFHRLKDSSRDLTASVGGQLMSARFDFANQNLRIAHLKRGQLERDIRIERQHALMLKGALAAGGIVLALMLFAVLSFRRSRNEVRDANVALTGVNARLERALAAKTEFLATTSHEIRTPLNGILGMAQVLLAQDEIDAEAREKVEIIHSSGEAMRALVDDILDVAKMEAGNVGVVAETTHLRAVLTETCALWRGHAEAKGLALSLDLAVPELVLSDEARLRQIVSNLLSNAVKFTEAGSVAVAAWTQPVAGGADRLRIAVTDTGIGIAPDQQGLVFDAFHQVDGATTRQFSGTGLGLAICRRLAEALGGSLTLASNTGAGSTFTLDLPLLMVAPAPAAEHAGRAARASDLERATVLLVEANLVTQGLVSTLLGRHAGAVETAVDGDRAMAALAGGTVHHLLIDAASARMAGMAGVDAVRALVSRANELDLFTTLLVQVGGDPSAEDLLTVGASQVVIRPVTGQALIGAMKQLYDLPLHLLAQEAA